MSLPARLYFMLHLQVILIKAVVIDLDDTLFLTEVVCFEMENEILEKMGRKPMERAVHLSTWGQPLFVAILERSPGVDLEKFKQLFEPTINHYIKNGKLDSISVQNLKALNSLISLSYQLFILTSRTHAEMQHLLHLDHPLSGKIKDFYYREKMEFHKPDWRAFSKLLAEHRLNASECVYVGDTISDAKSAKGAGLHFIASLESGLRTKADFKDLSVDDFIYNFSEIVRAVKLQNSRQAVITLLDK